MQPKLVWMLVPAGCMIIASLAAGPSSTASGPPATPAKPSATQPHDSTVDSLLDDAKPATQPEPAESLLDKPTTTPFENRDDLGYRPAVITTSDGEKFHARVATTLDKPIRVWDDEKKEYRDVPYKLIKSMEAKVIWERQEKEWHFRESGSDIKEYSGKTYPARELQYTVTLINGQSVTGAVDAPLYLEQKKGDDKILIMHKRDKGEIGQTLKDLIYVQKVEFE